MPQRPHFDFAAFYKALSATVSARDTNWKTVSEQTGVSQSTLSRMSKGRQPDAASLTALAAWSRHKPRRIHRGTQAQTGINRHSRPTSASRPYT